MIRFKAKLGLGVMIGLASCSGAHVTEQSRTNLSKSIQYSEEEQDTFQLNFELARKATEPILSVTEITYASLGPGQFGGVGRFSAVGKLIDRKNIPGSIIDLVPATIKKYEECGYLFLSPSFFIYDVKTAGVSSQKSVTFELPSIINNDGKSHVISNRATYRTESDAICITFSLSNGRSVHDWNMLLNIHDGSYRVWVAWTDMTWLQRYNPTSKPHEWSIRILSPD